MYVKGCREEEEDEKKLCSFLSFFFRLLLGREQERLSRHRFNIKSSNDLSSLAACVLYGEAFLECRQESGLDWRVSETSRNGLSTEQSSEVKFIC